MKPTAGESMEGEKWVRKQMARSLGWSLQTHRRRCQRGGARQRQLLGHQKRPRLENGAHVRHEVDAPRVPLFTLAGSPSGGGCRSPKSKRMEGQLWNFSDLTLQSCPVPGLYQVMGALGSSAPCGLGERKCFL